MAYHIFIHDSSSPNKLLLDLYLGSAATIDTYWESIGRKLELPIISAFTERADFEEGLALIGDDLVLFGKEMNIFEKYWKNESCDIDLPDGFLINLRKIIEQTEYAASRGLTVMIG